MPTATTAILEETKGKIMVMMGLIIEILVLSIPLPL